MHLVKGCPGIAFRMQWIRSGDQRIIESLASGISLSCLVGPKPIRIHKAASIYYESPTWSPPLLNNNTRLFITQHFIQWIPSPVSIFLYCYFKFLYCGPENVVAGQDFAKAELGIIIHFFWTGTTHSLFPSLLAYGTPNSNERGSCDATPSFAQAEKGKQLILTRVGPVTESHPSFISSVRHPQQ